MSPKISSTAVTSDKNWVDAKLQPLTPAAGTAAAVVDPGSLFISAQVGQESRILAMLEPAAMTKRLAIRKLNDEVEGRLSPSDTFASKTAG